MAVERRAAEPLTPLGLFRSSIFSISAAQFLMATMVLFVAMLYVPSFLQTVQHKSAFTAGLYVIPLLAGLVAATVIAGPVIARTGRYKIYPIIGAVLTGAGVGLLVQVALLAGQNAVEYRHLGTATGALNSFKSIGGACGAALFGAILVHGLTAGPTAGAYQAVFAWTIPFMVLALILAVIMPEKPLSEEMAEIAAGKAEGPEH